MDLVTYSTIRLDHYSWISENYKEKEEVTYRGDDNELDFLQSASVVAG